MKKIFALALAFIMVFSLAACGGKNEAPAGESVPESSEQGVANPESEPESAPESSEAEGGAPLAGSEWLGTKTGKFYSKFSGGKMYMEYEMEYGGMVMTLITATSGDKTYSESKSGGSTLSVSIMDGEYMYAIDHANKMVVKTALSGTAEQVTNEIITEEDINPADIVTGTIEIDGKTYDTEEFSMDGAKSTLCFDGDDLKYMIGEYAGVSSTLKVIRADGNVDESLFNIPADYQVVEY